MKNFKILRALEYRKTEEKLSGFLKIFTDRFLCILNSELKLNKNNFKSSLKNIRRQVYLDNLQVQVGKFSQIQWNKTA